MTTKPDRRASRLCTVADAVDQIAPGMVVGIGGFINSSHPMLIVREIIRRGLRDLTIVGAASAGLETDMLIASGCVKRVISTYVGGEALAPIGPAFRAAAESGKLDVFELDEALFYAGLRAAAQRLPFNPWKGGVGTSIPEVNPALKTFEDPISGETLIAVPAFNIDVAFFHAAHSDIYGNVQYVGHGWGDRAIWAASDRSYVQVEKIITNDDVRREPLKTLIPGATGVIRAPFGAHPFASPGFYVEDRKIIGDYVQAATRWAKDGDFSALAAFLDRFVREPADHYEYLERVGLRQLLGLHEY